MTMPQPPYEPMRPGPPIRKSPVPVWLIVVLGVIGTVVVGCCGIGALSTINRSPGTTAAAPATTTRTTTAPTTAAPPPSPTTSVPPGVPADAQAVTVVEVVSPVQLFVAAQAGAGPVADGDTHAKVMLGGLAPGGADNCHSPEAEATARNLLPIGDRLYLSKSLPTGATYAWNKAGELVNELIVKAGAATVSAPAAEHALALNNAERAAQSSKAGLWANCAVTPPAPPAPTSGSGGGGSGGGGGSVYYANCAEARAAGAAPLYRGQPGYRSGLDRDNDGIACE